MTYEEFVKIIDNKDADWNGDNAMQGLRIIEKYLPPNTGVIQGAEHDIIYSADIDTLINAGITKEDVGELGRLNWMIEHDYLACFV